AISLVCCLNPPFFTWRSTGSGVWVSATVHRPVPRPRCTSQPELSGKPTAYWGTLPVAVKDRANQDEKVNPATPSTEEGICPPLSSSTLSCSTVPCSCEALFSSGVGCGCPQDPQLSKHGVLLQSRLDPRARIKVVAKPVTDKVEREHCEHDRSGREEHQVRRIEQVR